MSRLKKIQDLALFLFAFSLSFELWNAFDFKNFSIGAMTGYIYLFSIILYPKFRFDRKESRKYFVPLFLFFIILTISSAINYTYVNDLSWFNMSIFQCIVLFSLIYIHLKDRGSRVANKMLLCYVFGAILLIVLYGFGFGVEYTIDMRLSVFGSFANGLGFNLSVTFIIILSLVFENKPDYGKKRYLLLLVLPLMLKAIAETGSRGAFITLAVGFIIFLFLIKMKKRYKIFFLAVGLLLSYTAFIYMMQTDVFKNRILYSIEEKDTSGRFEIWESVLPLFYENPVLGVGETGYYNYAKDKLTVFQGPHNVFIELLIYTGIIGFICYLMLLYQIYRKSLFSYRNLSFLLPVVLLAMILTLFLNGQGLSIKLVWLFFAYIIASAQPELNKKKAFKKHF